MKARLREFLLFNLPTCEPFEDSNALKALEVVDEDIWDPEIFQELQTDGVPRVRFYRVVGGYSSFLPFHRKVPENKYTVMKDCTVYTCVLTLLKRGNYSTRLTQEDFRIH